jgi:hypothetical protein
MAWKEEEESECMLLVRFVIDKTLSNLRGILLTYPEEILRILWLWNVMLTMHLSYTDDTARLRLPDRPNWAIISTVPPCKREIHVQYLSLGYDFWHLTILNNFLRDYTGECVMKDVQYFPLTFHSFSLLFSTLLLRNIVMIKRVMLLLLLSPPPLQFDIPAQHACCACRRFLISILLRGPSA